MAAAGAASNGMERRCATLVWTRSQPGPRLFQKRLGALQPRVEADALAEDGQRRGLLPSFVTVSVGLEPAPGAAVVSDVDDPLRRGSELFSHARNDAAFHLPLAPQGPDKAAG